MAPGGRRRMDFDFFWRGFAIGLSIAAPVGPIGVLCIRRTLADGRNAGLVSGLGAATADAAYGAIAGFGLTALSELLVGQTTLLQVAGGAFLIYLGLKTFMARPSERSMDLKSPNLVAAYLGTFLL